MEGHPITRTTTEMHATLKPVWDRAYTASQRDDKALLAVLVRGLAEQHPPTEIRAWCTERGVDSALLGGTQWRSFLSTARRQLADSQPCSPGAASKLSLAAARRTVARLFSPLPAEFSARRQVAIRSVWLTVGMTAIREARERGFDTILATESYLARLTGRSLGSVRKVRRDLIDLGWLVVVSKRGHAVRYRLGRLPRELDEIAWQHADTIDALAAGVPHQDPVAAVIATVSHATWSYSDVLGERHLLTAIAQLAGVEPASLGVGAVRARLRELGALPADPAAWAHELDAVAVETGAVERAQVRAAELKAASEKAAASLADFRERREVENAAKAKARSGLKAGLAVAGRVPSVEALRDDVEAWAGRLRAVFAASPPPGEVAVHLPGALNWRLQREGWGSKSRGRMVEYVLPAAEPVAEAA